jgi:hypothetical protein
VPLAEACRSRNGQGSRHASDVAVPPGGPLESGSGGRRVEDRRGDLALTFNRKADDLSSPDFGGPLQARRDFLFHRDFNVRQNRRIGQRGSRRDDAPIASRRF